ncbi:MAG TPA: hypothetical protein VG293_08025 [Solirubrobacteraceae bacterium]|nr:hypothetical protein [Solirubrobacteraceae bacterium]
MGEILDAAIKLYLGNARVLMGSAAAIVVPIQLLSGIVLMSAYSDGHDISSGFSGFGQTVTPAEAHARLGASAINGVTSWVAGAFVLAACIKALSDAYLGESPTATGSLRFGLRRLLPLLGLTIVYTIGQLLGFVALIITGIWLYAMWSVRVPACVIERAGPFRSLRRSYGLVKGRWWPVAGVLIVSYFMVLVIGGLISGGLIAAAISNSNPSVQFAVTISVLSGIISGVLLQPFSAAVVTVLYYDLRIRKEGYDLELLADQLGLEASGLPPASSTGRHRSPEGSQGAAGGFRGPVGPEDVGKPGGPPYWPPPPGWRPTD